MANVLNKDKQIAATASAAERSSIRAVAHMTGIHRDTIARLGVGAGQGCIMHIPPVVSPQTAVRAAIVQESTKRDRAKEN